MESAGFRLPPFPQGSCCQVCPLYWHLVRHGSPALVEMAEGAGPSPLSVHVLGLATRPMILHALLSRRPTPGPRPVLRRPPQVAQWLTQAPLSPSSAHAPPPPQPQVPGDGSLPPSHHCPLMTGVSRSPVLNPFLLSKAMISARDPPHALCHRSGLLLTSLTPVALPSTALRNHFYSLLHTQRQRLRPTPSLASRTSAPHTLAHGGPLRLNAHPLPLHLPNSRPSL